MFRQTQKPEFYMGFRKREGWEGEGLTMSMSTEDETSRKSSVGIVVKLMPRTGATFWISWPSYRQGVMYRPQSPLVVPLVLQMQKRG